MFCKTVWNGIHILPSGHIRLCPLGTANKKELDLQRCRDVDGQPMTILSHSIQDIMNSDKHCEVRRQNVESPNSWSPHCECCENREAVTLHDRTHDNTSRRIQLMRIDTSQVVSEHNYTERADKDGRVDWMPSSLDIKFGNLCNQKCVMCGPIHSHLWYDDWAALTDNAPFGFGRNVQLVRDVKRNRWEQPSELQWHESPIWWEKFEEMAPYLKHIYITGGEPMIVPAHAEMLDRLISRDLAKDIWLEYDTNCSTINNKLIERWHNFKKVDIRGSMDATEEQYELIRSGGDWETFKTNVIRLKQLEQESGGKIRLLSVSSCFQIPTMYSIIACEDWCRSVGVNFHLRFLETPLKLNVRILSAQAKLKLIEYYNRHTSYEKTQMILNFLNNHLDDKFHNQAAVDEYFSFMDFLDRSRNTDWRKTLPEVYQLLSEQQS